jgi:hypothetical protein
VDGNDQIERLLVVIRREIKEGEGRLMAPYKTQENLSSRDNSREVFRHRSNCATVAVAVVIEVEILDGIENW